LAPETTETQGRPCLHQKTEVHFALNRWKETSFAKTQEAFWPDDTMEQATKAVLQEVRVDHFQVACAAQSPLRLGQTGNPDPVRKPEKKSGGQECVKLLALVLKFLLPLAVFIQVLAP
jgi:hypothetical protein